MKAEALGIQNQNHLSPPPKEDLEYEKTPGDHGNLGNRINFWTDRLSVCAKNLFRDYLFLDKCSFRAGPALDHAVNPPLTSPSYFSISPQDTELPIAATSYCGRSRTGEKKEFVQIKAILFGLQVSRRGWERPSPRDQLWACSLRAMSRPGFG